MFLSQALALVQSGLLAAILLILLTLVRRRDQPAHPAYPATPPTRIVILKDGQPHHWCELGSSDYREALATPGLSLRHPDGSVELGNQ